MKNLKTIREEWHQYCQTFKLGTEHLVVDWWLSKLSQRDQELRGKIEGMKMPSKPDKEILRTVDGDREVKEEFKGIPTLFYNQALTDVLSFLDLSENKE